MRVGVKTLSLHYVSLFLPTPEMELFIDFHRMILTPGTEGDTKPSPPLSFTADGSLEKVIN